MQLPTFENYSGPNSLAILLQVPAGTLKVFFSYQTPVAYALNGKRTVRVNDWSTTTGKHLSAIDGGDKLAKAARIPGDLFERELAAVLAPAPAPLEELGRAGVELLREYHWGSGSKFLAAFRERGERSALGDGMARDLAHKLALRAAELGVS